MDQPLTQIDGQSGARRHFRYFDYIMAAFVAILLLSNLIGAAKLSWVEFFTTMGYVTSIVCVVAFAFAVAYFARHTKPRPSAPPNTK